MKSKIFETIPFVIGSSKPPRRVSIKPKIVANIKCHLTIKILSLLDTYIVTNTIL